jgi:hypothetical protein
MGFPQAEPPALRSGDWGFGCEEVGRKCEARERERERERENRFGGVVVLAFDVDLSFGCWLSDVPSPL